MTGDYRLVMHGVFAEGEAPEVSRRLYAWGVAMYKSVDDGASWSTIYTPSTTGFYAANYLEVAGGLDVIVAYELEAADDIVSVSPDGGASFIPVTPPRIAPATPFDFIVLISALTWILFNADEVYQTTDGGTSWVDVTGTYNANLWAQAALSSSKIWSFDSAGPASVGTIINLDGSGGSTYTKPAGRKAVNPFSDTQALLFNGATMFSPTLALVSGGSADDIAPAGATVEAWAGAATPDGALIVAHGVTPSVPSGEVWRSTDGGSSWTQVAADPELMCRFAYDQSIAVDRLHPTFWALVTGDFGMPGHCWVSTDSGVSWTQAGALPGADVQPIVLRVFSA